MNGARTAFKIPMKINLRLSLVIQVRVLQADTCENSLLNQCRPVPLFQECLMNPTMLVEEELHQAYPDIMLERLAEGRVITVVDCHELLDERR